MADIFVSYASADRERVAPLALALADHGWSVWWDRQVPPGKTFDEVIEEALDQAKVVIAVWTQAGVASRWVRTEAAEGAARGILVPVLMEDIRIPLAFRRIQAADLCDWEVGSDHAGFTELVTALTETISAAGVEEVVPPLEPEDPIARTVATARARAEEEDWDAVISLLGSLESDGPGITDEYPEAAELLARARRKRDALELYEEAEVLFAAGRWQEVVTKFDSILELDPDLEFGTNLREKAQGHLEKDREQRLAREYERAMRALQERSWSVSVARFEQLLDEAPDYRDVEERLESARSGAAADRRYRRLQELYLSGRWKDVVTGMTELATANPDYGDPDDLLGRARARLDEADRRIGGKAESEVDQRPKEKTRSGGLAAPPTQSYQSSPETALEQATVGSEGAGRPRLNSLRSRAPTWAPGVFVIVSAYMPWLASQDGGMYSSLQLPMSWLMDHDFSGRRVQNPIMLAVPILILGSVIAATAGRADRSKFRRSAAIGLIILVLLHGNAVRRASWYFPTDWLSSFGPYVALFVGLVAILRDPLLLGSRDSRAAIKPTVGSRRLALALGAIGAVFVLAGLALPWKANWHAHEFPAGLVFGIQHAGEVPWPFSVSALVVLVLIGGAVAVWRFHRGMEQTLIGVGTAMIWIVAGFWLTIAGNSAVAAAPAIEFANRSVGSGFWTALIGAIVVALAVPVTTALSGWRSYRSAGVPPAEVSDAPD